jgi:ATP-dependent Lon protease
MSKYNLRSQKDKIEFQKILSDLFPSKHATRKLKKLAESESDSSDSDYEEEDYEEEDDEEEDDEEYEDDDGEEEEEEEEADNEKVKVNITFTLDESSDEEGKEYDSTKNGEFMDKVQNLGNELAKTYKDTPMFQKFLKAHNELLEQHEKKKGRIDKITRNNYKTEFNALISNKPKNEQKYFESLTTPEQLQLINKLKAVKDLDNSTKPLSICILDADIPNEYKVIALQKLKVRGSESDDGKNKAWLNEFIRIPFNQFSKLPVTITDGPDSCREFMMNARKILDECTYGLNDAKLQIMQYLGQLISNPVGTGTAIALEGPMGTGKTTLITKGISKILNRPFEIFALGGATDSSNFKGHMITYEGSVCGNIAKSLMKLKVMNPIFYFDELDKVSDTPKGEEIIGLLTHLIDSSQNSMFQDDYFPGIYLDLSRALFIFSYNDRSKVNAVLRDRMAVIRTEGYTPAQKIIIIKKYLEPIICSNVNLNIGDVTIPDLTIQYIIENYTDDEKGVRNLKRCIETIYSKLNLIRLIPNEKLFDLDMTAISFPVHVTIDLVKKLIKTTTESKTPYMMYM